MNQYTSTLLYKYGLLFAIIPVISTYLLGHIFKFVFQDTLESMNAMPINDPERVTAPVVEYIFPFAVLCGLLAFCIWVILMKRNPTANRGIVAGLVTVFLAYPVLGFTIGLVYPDVASRIQSAIANALVLSFMGNIMTFWLTYPLGAIFGWRIGQKFVKSLEPKLMHVFD